MILSLLSPLIFLLYMNLKSKQIGMAALIRYMRNTLDPVEFVHSHTLNGTERENERDGQFDFFVQFVHTINTLYQLANLQKLFVFFLFKFASFIFLISVKCLPKLQ